MKTEAILFDKDGTLMAFDPFWVAVSETAVRDVLTALGMEEVSVARVMALYGVENGVADIDGVLCKGTYEQAGEILHTVVQEYGCAVSRTDVIRMLTDSYDRHMDAGTVLPTCAGIEKVLCALKRQGKKLFVVTTDDTATTHFCLEKLGILSFFDGILCDDGKTPLKPAPDSVYAIARQCGIATENILMVGDTMTDVQFARNAGIRVVCVAKSEQNAAHLAPHADAVMPDISYLPQYLL